MSKPEGVPVSMWESGMSTALRYALEGDNWENPAPCSDSPWGRKESEKMEWCMDLGSELLVLTSSVEAAGGCAVCWLWFWLAVDPVVMGFTPYHRGQRHDQCALHSQRALLLKLLSCPCLTFPLPTIASHGCLLPRHCESVSRLLQLWLFLVFFLDQIGTFSRWCQAIALQNMGGNKMDCFSSAGLPCRWSHCHTRTPQWI
jgi:hypothetical protein